jgi:hypothetical protein
MPKLYNSTPLLFTPLEEPAGFGRNTVSFIVKGSFDIVPGAPATPARDQKPFAGDTPFMDPIGRSLAWPSDLVPWKPNTDFIVIGAFHQPGGIPAPEGRCGFRFGPLAKSLRIRGPRLASRLPAQGTEPPGPWSVTAPEPVLTVPLRWELSLGGLRDPRNPYGMGGDTRLLDGLEVRRMPLIESCADPARPENFAPVPPILAERQRKLGTRDQGWSLFRAPLPPDDFDPSHANAAPADQQAGDSPRGDETITLVNLHPTQPELSFQLPGLRARVAVLRRRAAGLVAEEVPMRIDTVAALPGEGKLVILWRGVLELETRRFDTEIPVAECAVESLDAAPADPDLPRRVLDRWRAAEGAKAAREEQLAAIARAEMKKLLPKAGLPAAVAALVENDAPPDAILEAVGKHILDTVAGIEARLGTR